MNELYGVDSTGTAGVAAALGTALGLEFRERESFYLGDYWLAKTGETKIRVVEQPDPSGRALEADFGRYPVLVYVDGDTPVTGLDGVRTPGGALEKLKSD